MAVDIFSAQPGSVTAIDSAGLPPLTLFLEGWGGGPAFNSIITGLSIQQQAGVQFVHTLREFIYVYVFGERIGDITVSGLSFARGCTGAAGALNLQYHGLEWVNAFYLTNRATVRASPLVFVLGLASPFVGFLVGCNLQVNDPERGLGQWTLRFATVPQKTKLL